MPGGPPFITLTPTPVITPLPQTTYSDLIANVTGSGFNIWLLPTNALTPYGYLTFDFSIPFFIIFFAYFYSLWVGHGNLRMASIIGIIFGGMILVTGGGLGVSLPAPMYPLAFGALSAAIAGFILSMFKNA
jgi:hypothetical protein